MSFTIKELEVLSGIKAHTIRIWEQRYNFLKPSRTLTNIRTYSNEELKTLLTVALLNKHGYKISRIDNMLPEQRRQQALLLNDAAAQQEQVVNELIGCMIDLDIIRFETILTRHIECNTIFTTISTIVFSFLEKVGILWQTNRINPAHEHVATNIIRQKLVAAIDQLPHVHGAGPLFLLFLPEEEHHELGLLFVYYLLKKRGIPVIYLGANVPLADVVYVVEHKKPAYLYLHLISFPRKQVFQKYLATLSARSKATQIVISGYVIDAHKKPLPGNVVAIKSLSGILSYIGTL